MKWCMEDHYIKQMEMKLLWGHASDDTFGPFFPHVGSCSFGM